MNTYVKPVKKDIEQRKPVTPRKIRSNLSKDEKVALNYQNEITSLLPMQIKVAQWL